MPLFWRREIEACVWDLHTDSTALSHISAQRGLSYPPPPPRPSCDLRFFPPFFGGCACVRVAAARGVGREGRQAQHTHTHMYVKRRAADGRAKGRLRSAPPAGCAEAEREERRGVDTYTHPRPPLSHTRARGCRKVSLHVYICMCASLSCNAVNQRRSGQRLPEQRSLLWRYSRLPPRRGAGLERSEHHERSPRAS